MGGNGFMGDMSHEDAVTILKAIGEMKEDISDIKLAQQDAAGKTKGNQEITELKLKHMEETNKLREEKHEAQVNLINEQVQLNKDSISKLYDRNLKSETIKTKLNILFAAICVISPLVVIGIVQMILIWGKVKGF